MTVSQQTPSISSTGNGVTTVFPYPFKIVSASDLEVSVDGVVKTLNADYTVSGVGDDAGGNVTFVTAPANLSTVVRRRNMQYVRTTDYQDQGELPSAVLNADQDAPILMLQQLDEQVGRAFKAPVGEQGTGVLPSAAARAGMYLAFDALGDPVAASGSGTDTGLRTDLAATGGAALVGFKQSGTGTIERPIETELRERVSVKQFGAVGDGVADDTAALAAARAWLVANATQHRLVFPSGIYKYSSSPNWAIQNAVIEAEGEVRLRYTGTGNAVILDAGPLAGDLCFQTRFGAGNKFHVDCPSTAQNGVYVRSVHHGHIGVNVHGCGTGFAGLYVAFAVCTQFDVVVSGNEPGSWYGGVSAKPAAGVRLTERLAGETASYCYFPNPIIEGCTVGIELIKTLGNLFVGGTSEGCTAYGVDAQMGSNWDRFIGTDFEANTVVDIWGQGRGLEFVSCDTLTSLTLGTSARGCKIMGGQHQTILVDAGATACSVVDTTYNRLGSTGTFTDTGTATVIDNVRNELGALYLTGTLDTDPAPIAAGTSATYDVTVTGATLTDFAMVSYSLSTAGLQMTAAVISANTVRVTLENVTGGAIDLAPGRFRVKCSRGVA